MNLVNTIRMLNEKRNDPPFDVSKADYAGAAKELTQYAKTKGGMDKNDFLAFANRMSAIANKKAPRVTAKFARELMDLDTSPREKIVSVMRNNGIKVSVQGGGFKIEDYTIEELEELDELEEAMVRGKEVFDKTFANRTQADNFAKKNGGRVKQVGRVFYVFKEDVNEAKEDEEPASPDESSMASKQAEFIQYVGREVAEHVKGGKEFPEWMQNKLSGLHEKAKDMHATLGDHGKKKDVKESVDEMFEEVMDEARDPSKSGGSGYDLYHKDFSSAMKHAYDYAKKKFGIEIDPKEIDDKVASGPRKPSAGKTNSYRLKSKDGKKGVQIQVANLDNKKYELNMYKESVEMELDENAGLIKDYQGMKAQGKKDHNILDALMSMPKYKRMSKDQMAKIIGDAKRKGIFKEDVELDEAYKTPAEAGAYEAGKKAARSGKKYDDNPNKKGTAEFTAWSKGHNEARAKGMKEEVELTESPMVTFTVPNVTSDMASKLEKIAKEKNIEYSRKGRTVVLKGKKIDVTMLRTKMGLAQTNIPMVPVKEEVELDEAFVKWQVKVGAKVWRGTARNAGEAVKKARPSMGNLDLSKASVTRIDEEKVEENTMTLEEAVMLSVFGEAKKVKEDNTNDKSDDGEGMDKVQPKALKKKFKDRKDKDIDNDGDTDDSDEYLHKKRQAVSKAIDKNDNEGEEDKDEKQKKVGKSGKQTKVDVNPSLDEDMSDSEKEKKDEILKSMEKKKEQFVKKYGDRATEVMNRTAVKMAKKNA